MMKNEVMNSSGASVLFLLWVQAIIFLCLFWLIFKMSFSVLLLFFEFFFFIKVTAIIIQYCNAAQAREANYKITVLKMNEFMSYIKSSQKAHKIINHSLQKQLIKYIKKIKLNLN